MKTKEIHFHLNDNDFTVLTENPSGLVPDAENICRRAAAGNTEAAFFMPTLLSGNPNGPRIFSCHGIISVTLSL